MKLPVKLTRGLGQISRAVGKNSPIILTVVGVVGLGATAVFSYKSSKKVEVVVSKLEDRRKDEEQAMRWQSMLDSGSQLTDLETGALAHINANPIDRVELGKEIIGAVALPVLTGLLSITAIGLSYHIQNNRLGALAAALASSTAEQLFFKEKYIAENGKEKAKRFYSPTNEATMTVVNEDGEQEDVMAQIKKDIPSTHGVWYDKSSEYVIDDHAYNMQYIRSCEESLQLKMFGTGWLRMNEVLDKLGLERTRAGELLGWSTAQDFAMDLTVTNVYNEKTGTFDPQIYIKWSTPKYIYDNVDYNWS